MHSLKGEPCDVLRMELYTIVNSSIAPPQTGDKEKKGKSTNDTVGVVGDMYY